MSKKWKFITAVLIAVVAFGGSSCQNEDEYTCFPSSVKAEPGDTIWAIVQDHCTGQVRSAIEEAIRLNGTDIMIGQGVKLP
jgi:hypothetical protein